MKTEIKLTRAWYTANSTISIMEINGTFFCYALEDVCRDLNRDGDLKDAGEAKVKGKTAIPAGRYEVVVDFSPHFNKPMPHILNVPGYEGIRIHPGNTQADTEGCLVLGSSHVVDFVENSRDTFDRFFIRLKALVTNGQVFITIIDQPK